MRRTTARSEQTQISTIQPGDRVRSIWLGRIGTVVKVHADSSAAVRWNDGDKRLKRQTMPRSLLEVIEQTASAGSSRVSLPNGLASLVNNALRAAAVESTPNGAIDTLADALVRLAAIACAEVRHA